jgi:hypothetical protein
MTQPFPPEICSVCKDPNHIMALEKRREIQYLRTHFPDIVTPLLPEEYHTHISAKQAGVST